MLEINKPSGGGGLKEGEGQGEISTGRPQVSLVTRVAQGFAKATVGGFLVCLCKPLRVKGSSAPEHSLFVAIYFYLTLRH